VSDPEFFARWLRERRKELDLTQERLAERAGLSPSAVRKLEGGQRKPSRQVAELLAEVLRIPREARAHFLQAARGGSEIEEAQATPSNLPSRLTALIGREVEVSVLTEMVSGDSARLITVLGPPGIGKTSLALSAAKELVGYFQDGVYVVPLAPVREPAGVIRAIAATLSLHDTGLEPLSLTVREHIREKRVLLVLDNFEQVVSASPSVISLLERCPNLKVLVTSREALRVRGEKQVHVQPLSTPPQPDIGVPDDLLGYGAIRMFVERARDVVPDFRLTGKNAGVVADICAHLDGLPLAIELVAAHTRLLPPYALLARLKGRTGEKGAALEVLAGGARDLPDRHRTLRDAIGWSYDLLSEGERLLFNRLGVFAGGWTLASAEAVCNALGDLSLPVLVGLSSLLDKSLLKREGAEGREDEPRYGMLETIREYAAERLEKSGEAEKVKGWLAQYYLALTEGAKLQVVGRDQSIWVQRLDAEHDNIRAALRWAIASGDVEIAGRIVAGLAYYWYARGHISEGLLWLKRVTEREEWKGLPESLQAELLSVAGFLASAQYNFEQATRWLDESLKLSRRNGERVMIGVTLNALGMAETSRGDYERAESVLREAVAIFEELGDRRRAGVAFQNLALAALFRGDAESAQALAMEALSLVRTEGDQWNLGISLATLGLALSRRGEYRHAEALCDEACAAFRDLDDRGSWLGAAIVCQAEVARRQGDYGRAESYYKGSLSLEREETNYRIIAANFMGLGLLAVIKGHAERAVSLFGVLDGWSERLKGVFVTPAERPEYEEGLAATRQVLDATSWALAWERGRAMSVVQAVKYALDET
jgi:predicted ATPase/DNA-binding XRE family transcriptional regulator